jgi:hypothetical protein
MQPSGSDAVAALNAHAIAMGWGLRCYEALDFVQPELHELSELWHDKALATGWPSRGDFDARTMKTWLPHLSIVERVTTECGAQRWRFRLTGTDLSHLFGESTGCFLDELLPQPFLERWTAAYDTVLAANVPLRFVTRFELPQVRFLHGESFSVPLANGDAPRTTILGVMYVTAKPQELRAAG